MNKEELLNKFLKDMTAESDNLRKTYPNTSYSDGKHMLNGFEFCTQKAVNWIEQFIEAYPQLMPSTAGPSPYPTDYFSQKPIAQAVPKSSEKNDKLKKVGNALSDVGKDVLKFIGSNNQSPINDKKDLYKL